MKRSRSARPGTGSPHNAVPQATAIRATRSGGSAVRYYDFGPVSFRIDLQVLAMTAVATLVLACLSLWALTLGSYEVPLDQVIAALRGRGTARARFIVADIRLPRLLSAVLVGAALSMAGALVQSLVRNPLVSPDIIGINAGASAATVFWVVSGFAVSAITPVAFVGAVLAALMVYVLSWRGRIATARLVLVGIGVNAMLVALVQFLIVRGRVDDVQRIYQWMAGSLYASTWSETRILSLAVVVLAPLGAASLWTLRILQIGESTAQVVGVAVEPVRLTVLAVSCALSAVAVSTSGPIVFVALVVPHFARMLAGAMNAGVFALCAVLGGILLVGADMVAQHALPVTLPAGVVIAALGAPYFLVLLYRSQTRVAGAVR